MKNILFLAAIALCTSSLSASVVHSKPVLEVGQAPVRDHSSFLEFIIQSNDHVCLTEVTQELPGMQTTVDVFAPAYVPAVNLVDLTLFCRPVIYEWANARRMTFRADGCRFKYLSGPGLKNRGVTFYKRIPRSGKSTNLNPGICS